VTETQTPPADLIGGIDFGSGFGREAVMARAAEAKAAAAARAAAAGSQKVTYFKLEKPGDKAIIRLISDIQPVASNPVPWITVKQHGGLKVTRPRPAGYTGNWPETMGAICRRDPMFAARYSNCYPCEHMLVHRGQHAGKPERASDRTWALAVLREEVFGSPEMVEAGQCTPAEVGKSLGVRTKRREVKVLDKDGKETGEVRSEPEVVWINQGEKNFFGALTSLTGREVTILDRDLEVERFGKELQTEYKISPFRPMMVPDPDDSSKEVVLDLRDPRLMLAVMGPKLDEAGQPVLWSAEDPVTTLPDGTSIAGTPMANIPDLRQTIAKMASDEHHGRFFDPSYQRDDEKATAGGQAGQAGQPQAPATPAADIPSTALDKLKTRVQGYPGAQGGQDGGGQAAAPSGQRVSNL
jgi:hypothetical protein